MGKGSPPKKSTPRGPHPFLACSFLSSTRSSSSRLETRWTRVWLQEPLLRCCHSHCCPQHPILVPCAPPGLYLHLKYWTFILSSTRTCPCGCTPRSASPWGKWSGGQVNHGSRSSGGWERGWRDPGVGKGVRKPPLCPVGVGTGGLKPVASEGAGRRVSYPRECQDSGSPPGPPIPAPQRGLLGSQVLLWVLTWGLGPPACWEAGGAAAGSAWGSAQGSAWGSAQGSARGSARGSPWGSPCGSASGSAQISSTLWNNLESSSSPCEGSRAAGWLWLHQGLHLNTWHWLGPQKKNALDIKPRLPPTPTGILLPHLHLAQTPTDRGQCIHILHGAILEEGNPVSPRTHPGSKPAPRSQGAQPLLPPAHRCTVGGDVPAGAFPCRDVRQPQGHDHPGHPAPGQPPAPPAPPDCWVRAGTGTTGLPEQRGEGWGGDPILPRSA